MSECPCSSGREFEDCCEPYLDGAKEPETAEALLRSRYTAFVEHKIDYVRNTTHPKSLGKFDEEDARAWSEGSDWLGFEIFESTGGGEDDDEATIEFAASYLQNEEEKVHREISQFKRDRGRWYFVDGKYAGVETFVRDEPKVGRNEPCPCGSGKKYKKCCGR
jgi:SEC-C motif-containing protein